MRAVLVCLGLLALCSSTAALSKCYTCSSALDPDCEEEFEEELFQKFESDCTDHKYAPKTPGTWPIKGCRKILQEVNGEYRTVRQCAYGGEDVDGFKRTGNEGVRMWYYQCSDGDFCNGARGAGLGFLSLAASLLLAAVLA